MKSPTPRQLERRQRILKATRDHLSRYGYDGLSMRDLADSAGVSPTTLYNLFESKDALILSALQDLLQQVNDSARAENLTGMARVLARQDAVARQIIATPRYAEAMTRLLFNAEPADPIADVLLTNAMDVQRDSLREMQALGELRGDVDIDWFARSLAANGWATILLWMKGFIALQDLRQEYARTAILTLYPAMTRATAQCYERELASASPIARAL